MIPLNSLIALVSLAAPVDAPRDKPPCPLSALNSMALALELIDTNESHYRFHLQRCLGDDLTDMRRRYFELRDAPRGIDAERLPAFRVCRKCREANRQYRQWLEETRACYPGEPWFDAAVDECNQLYRAWDYAEDAANDGYGLYLRRLALMRLRDAIGPYRYYAGCLPPPVPAWRLWQID